MIDPATIARNAIVAELKRRFAEKDPEVRPMDSRNSHHWHHPQENYFHGMGQMKCPICPDGLLAYSRSGYNGHVLGRCTTVNCVAWME